MFVRFGGKGFDARRVHRDRKRAFVSVEFDSAEQQRQHRRLLADVQLIPDVAKVGEGRVHITLVDLFRSQAFDLAVNDVKLLDNAGDLLVHRGQSF